MTRPARVRLPLFALALGALLLSPTLARADEATAVPKADAPAAKKLAPKNRDLESAKLLVSQSRPDAALRELEIAARLPGNTDQTVTEIAAVRSEALLLKKQPAELGARGLMLQVLHQDPEGKLYEDAPEVVQRLVDKLKAEHVLVLHDRVKQSSPGLPVRLRARVSDPKHQVATLTLHMKGHAVGGWTTDAMTADGSSWTGYIRDPSLLAPPGVTDGFTIDYYLSAEDAAGNVLDTNGSQDAPLELQITSTQGSDDVDLSAITLHDRPPAPLPSPAVAAPPWWKRWYTLTGAGVVVVGVTAGIIYAATRPQPLDPHLGVLTLP